MVHKCQVAIRHWISRYAYDVLCLPLNRYYFGLSRRNGILSVYVVIFVLWRNFPSDNCRLDRLRVSMVSNSTDW